MVCDNMSFDIKSTKRHDVIQLSIYLQNHTVSHPTRQQLWLLRLWGP